MRCGVVGAGAWGTALADLLATNGCDVRLWAFERDVADAINERHENLRFLPQAQLAPAVVATSDLADGLADARLVLFAVPSAHLRTVARAAAGSIEPRAT